MESASISSSGLFKFHFVRGKMGYECMLLQVCNIYYSGALNCLTAVEADSRQKGVLTDQEQNEKTNFCDCCLSASACSRC